MRRAVLAGVAALLAPVAAVPVLAQAEPPPFRPVTRIEAVDAVQRTVQQAAQGRFAQLCQEALAQCGGLSSAVRVPGSDRAAAAPRGDRPLQVRCTFALPASLRHAAWGDGHVVVLAGEDAQGRSYVSQQLVVREGDAVRVHEPAFWLGIAYRGFGGVRGASWSSAVGVRTGPSVRALAERSCHDTAGYLAEVAPPA